MAEVEQLEVKRITRDPFAHFLSGKVLLLIFYFAAGEADEHVGAFGNQMCDSCQTLLGGVASGIPGLCDGELMRSSPGCQKSFVTAGV